MKDESGLVEPLKFKLTLKEAVDIVWDAWIETEKITKWFSPEANIEARQGGAYELFFDITNHNHQSTKGCKIIVFNPMKTLAFTWKGPDEFGGTMNESGELTSVRVDFTTKGKCTEIEVEHSGWGKGVEWGEAKEWHNKAWEGVLTKLKSLYT